MKFYSLAALALLGVAHAEEDANNDDNTKANEGADKTTEPAKCTVKFDFFSDDKCATAKTDGTDAVKTEWEAYANDLDKCKAKDDKFVKNTCDGTALTTATYTDAECKTADKVDDKPVTSTAKWGECTKSGDIYFKVTGAKTLMVAATAALALVGSQF